MSETEQSKVLFQRAEARVGRVPLSVKLYQGIGALPGQHKDWAFSTLLLLYYSQILGLPATYASLVIAVTLIVDAVTDPLVGAYSDGFRSRLGRRHPLMFGAILPSALAAYGLFVPPAELSITQLTLWMFVCTLLVRVSFTFFAVPWHAVAAELSQDYGERTSIITYRMAVGWLGGVVFIFLMLTYLFPSTPDYANGLLDPSRYPLFAGVLAALMVIWMGLTTTLTRNQVPYLPQPTEAVPYPSLLNIWRPIRLALHSRNFRLLFFSTLISAAVVGTGGVFDIFMNLYFWEFSTEQLRWFSIAVIGAVASFVTAGLLQARFDKLQIMIGSILFLTVLVMVKVLFRFWNIWPENGDPRLLWLFLAHACVAAYLASMILIMFASMMADLVDEQEFETGLRQEGIFSSGISFAAKATTSLGVVAGGLLLDMFIRFPRGAAPGGVDEQTLFWLAATDGLIVPAVNLIPLLLLSRYTMTHERLMEVQSALSSRRQAGR